MTERFFQNKLALITLLSACGIVAVSMGLRQTFGLFSDFFVKDLQCTVTQFGLAIGIQMLMWGMFAPIFGAMADKIGGNKVSIIAFVFPGVGPRPSRPGMEYPVQGNPSLRFGQRIWQ